MADFSMFAGEQSERLLREETGDTPLGRTLAGAGTELARAHIDRFTTRRSYGLFSTYTLDLDGASGDAVE